MEWSDKKLVTALILVWTISLFLPGLHNSWDSGSIIWLLILLIGWLGIFQGILSWYANPLALIAIVYLLKWKFKQSFHLSIVSVILWLQAIYFQWTTISYIDSNGPFWTLAIGYYLWMFTLILLSVNCWINLLQKKSEQPVQK